MTDKARKLLILNLPYVILGLIATNLGEAWRLAEGADISEKLLALFEEYADVPIYKIGFFNRWKEEPIWK